MLTLYKNLSENNKLNKEITRIGTPNAFMPITEIDVLHPIVDIPSDTARLNEVNYVYIDEFSRYYFCKVVHDGTMAHLVCDVDPLMSWKNQINVLSGIVKRSNISNPYLIDSEVQKLNYNQYTVKQFPNSFETSLNYILTVCGG